MDFPTNLFTHCLSEIPNLAQMMLEVDFEETGPRSLAPTEISAESFLRSELYPSLLPSIKSVVKVKASIERIDRYLSSDKPLQSVRRKPAYVFGGRVHDKQCVYGSRIGQHLLFRIAVESDHHGSIAVESVEAVQIHSPSNGKKLDLQFHVTANSPQKWTFIAFLEAEALHRMADDARSLAEWKMPKSDFAYHLCVYMTIPGDLNRHRLLANAAVTWRLIDRHAPMCQQFFRRIGFNAWSQMPQSLRCCIASKSDPTPSTLQNDGEMD